MKTCLFLCGLEKVILLISLQLPILHYACSNIWLYAEVMAFLDFLFAWARDLLLVVFHFSSNATFAHIDIL